MPFIPHGKGQSAAHQSDQVITIYDSSNSTTEVRAVLRMVDRTNTHLFKQGVRPDVDIIAYVSDSTTVQKGWKVEWNSTWYEVSEKEDQMNDTTRLLLQETGTNIDLTT